MRFLIYLALFATCLNALHAMELLDELDSEEKLILEKVEAHNNVYVERVDAQAALEDTLILNSYWSTLHVESQEKKNEALYFIYSLNMPPNL